MSRTIEIKEEHDPSSYFCFQPVIIEKSNKITWEDTQCLEEKFLIEEGDIECFLFCFLNSYQFMSIILTPYKIGHNMLIYKGER